MRPLEGIRILNWCRHTAGTVAATRLSHLGALVVEAPPPGSGSLRDQPELSRCDVVIHDLSPLAAEQRGSDIREVLALHSRLIYGFISSDDVGAGPPSSDPNARLTLNEWRLIERLAGDHLVEGVLACLVRRGVTDEGGIVEVRLAELRGVVLGDVTEGDAVPYRLHDVPLTSRAKPAEAEPVEVDVAPPRAEAGPGIPCNPEAPSVKSAADARILRLAEADNVDVVVSPIVKGETFRINGLSVRASRDFAAGFKLANRPIEAGQRVLKYGAPIGTATARIEAGELVHTANLKSDYLPTYLLDQANPFVRGA